MPGSTGSTRANAGRRRIRSGAPSAFAWDYRPGSRGGLALGDMRPDQRSSAMTVVRAAMSDRGADEVAAIIELETILGELERGTGRSGHTP